MIKEHGARVFDGKKYGFSSRGIATIIRPEAKRLKKLGYLVRVIKSTKNYYDFSNRSRYMTLYSLYVRWDIK
jgi:hypothetical protein